MHPWITTLKSRVDNKGPENKDQRPILYECQMSLNDPDLTKFQLKDNCFIVGGNYTKGNLPKDSFDK